MSEPIKLKRKRRPQLSMIDQMMARERNQMEVQMRRNAVLQYVGEQLAELNGMLRSAGFFAAPATPVGAFGSQIPAGAVLQEQPVHVPRPVARPCTWCGQPGQPMNTGGGVMQDLCMTHARALRAQAIGPENGFAGAKSTGYAVDRTDAPPPPPPVVNRGKVLMQPIEADVRLAQQHREPVDGAIAEGFEEIDDGTA